MTKLPTKLLMLMLAMMIAAILLTACAQKGAGTSVTNAGGKSQELTKVRFANLAVGLDSIPHMLAVEKGIFAKYGIDLQVVNFPKGGAEATAGVASGQVDMGSYGTPILTGISRGLPIKIVASPPVKDIPFVLVGKKGINSVQELKGKTVATGALGGGSHQSFLKILAGNGLRESDVKVVSTGGTDAELILRSGKVDAVITSEPLVTKLEKDGVGTVLARAYDYYGKYQHSYVLATDKFIQSNPDIIRNFLKASRESHEYARDHLEELVAYASKTINLDEGLIREYYQKQFVRWDLSFKVDIEGTENAVNIVKDMKEIESNVVFDKDKWLDLRFLE